MRAPHAIANCLSEIPQFVLFFSSQCDTRAAHSRFASRRLRRHIPFMYSRALRSFSRFALAPDGCAALIAHVESHNLCRLPQ
jgi:hypothetical protein